MVRNLWGFGVDLALRFRAAQQWKFPCSRSEWFIFHRCLFPIHKMWLLDIWPGFQWDYMLFLWSKSGWDMLYRVGSKGFNSVTVWTSSPNLDVIDSLWYKIQVLSQPCGVLAGQTSGDMQRKNGIVSFNPDQVDHSNWHEIPQFLQSIHPHPIGMDVCLDFPSASRFRTSDGTGTFSSMKQRRSSSEKSMGLSTETSCDSCAFLRAFQSFQFPGATLCHWPTWHYWNLHFGESLC